jgi:hypothetical protein
MKSNIIKISDENNNINAIFAEVENFSTKTELDVKKALKIRLLAEELVAMLKELSGSYEGEFFLEQEDFKFDLITRICVNKAMDNKTKKGFIGVSSDKKNAAAKGIMGKIRDVVENFMYPENATFSANYVAYQLEADALGGASWSLNQNNNQEKQEEWDEIEKSIIEKVADNVKVSVKCKYVEIVITKDFT